MISSHEIKVCSQAGAAIVIALFLFVPPLYAVGSAGFENASLGAKALGRGNAFTADADDPSAVSHNPAGMSYLKDVEVTGGFAGLNLITDYKAASGGVDTRSASKLKLVPNSYLTLKVPFLPVHAGVGVNAPFGLANQYPSTHPFRYVGYKNELTVLGCTFAGSLQLHPKFSVGAGATYYDATLKQRFKLNSTRITHSVLPFWPDLDDASSYLHTSGDGWGWSLGAIFKPYPRHTLGFHYRSKARLNLSGYLDTEDLYGPILQAVFGGQTSGTPIHTHLMLPPQATWAYKYQATKTWDVEVDFGWTGWHTFREQNFTIGNPNAVLNGLTPIPQGYRDTFSFHLGSDWDITRYLTLRGGYFFYDSPARRGNLGPVIPDSDRQGFSTGMSLHYKNISLDLVYIAELFVERKVADTNVGVLSGIEADGKYTSFLNLFGVNITYRFDYPWVKCEEEKEK
jgi:long-chain fatty acid transport protein